MTYDASIADDQQSSSAALTLETDLAAAAARPPSIGERLRSPQTIISFVVAFALIYFIFTQMHINIGDVWSQILSLIHI